MKRLIAISLMLIGSKVLALTPEDYLTRYPEIKSVEIRVASDWSETGFLKKTTRELQQDAEGLLNVRLQTLGVKPFDVKYNFENEYGCKRLEVVETSETSILETKESQSYYKSGASILTSISSGSFKFLKRHSYSNTRFESERSTYQYYHVERDVLCTKLVRLTRSTISASLPWDSLSAHFKNDLIQKHILRKFADLNSELTKLNEAITELTSHPILTKHRAEAFLGKDIYSDISLTSWSNKQIQVINRARAYLQYVYPLKNVFQLATEYDDTNQLLENIVEMLLELEDGNLVVVGIDGVKTIFSRNQIKKIGPIGTGRIQNSSKIYSFYGEKDILAYITIVDLEKHSSLNTRDLSARATNLFEKYAGLRFFSDERKIFGTENFLLEVQIYTLNQTEVSDPYVKRTATRGCVPYRYERIGYSDSDILKVYTVCPRADILELVNDIFSTP